MSRAEVSETRARRDSSRSLPDEPVLVVAPVGRDAALACEVLSDAGLACLVVADAQELRKRLRQGAGALLIAEEALTPETRVVLGKALKAQPSWSDLTLILLTKEPGKHGAGRSRGGHADALHALGSYGNVAVLERPLRLPTLASVVGASLRARRRQYELRDLIGQLRDLNETLERRVDERTRALERSEEQFTLARHLSPSPMIIVDPANHCLVDVNEAFLQLTGYERTEAVAHTTLDLGLFVKSKALTATPADNRNEPKPSSELLIRTKSGEARSVLSSSRLIQWNGEAMLLATLFDITERKQTEEQLMRAIQEVMNDTSWFSQRVIEQLAHVRSGGLGVMPDIDLSKREREVLEGLAKGLNNDAIATELGIAIQTVRNYISAVYDKLDVHSRGEAIVWARERGIV